MPFINGYYEAPRLPVECQSGSISSIVEYLYKQDPSSCTSAFLQKYGKELVRPEYKHQFITIALPTENYALSKLKKIINNINYTYLDNAYLTVEMFSGELKKKNLHIHILKKGIYNKTKLIRDMSRKFKVCDNFVNIKKGTKESDYLNRLAYLNGEKVDELKKENCDLDRIWRDNNGFQQIYTL